MSVKKAYKTLIITVIFMMTTIILYALNVSKLALSWGMSGFVVATIFSLLSVVLSIKEGKHDRDITQGSWAKYRFEILDWLTFLSVSLMGIFMVFMFFILPSDVQHSSMMPTLSENDRILVYHFKYEPERGDIIIIRITEESYPLVPSSMFIERDNHGLIDKVHDEIFFVKRIYAVPGDQLRFVNYDESTASFEIEINGTVIIAPTDEPYYVTNGQREIMLEGLENGRVKEGRYFAFGDNANGYGLFPASYDTRSFGALYEKDIVGKAIYRLWPLGGLS